MNDYKFTKALLNKTPATTTSNMHGLTDMDRIERIHDNMSGINPITKEKMVKTPLDQNRNFVSKQDNQLQDNLLMDQLAALRHIKKD